MQVIQLPFGLANRDGLARKLARATLGSAGVRIVGLALTFFVGVQLARHLGPAGYGVYGTVMAIVGLLLVPAQLGLPQLIARDIPVALTTHDTAKVKGTLIWYTKAVLVSSAVMVAVGLCGRLLIPTEHGVPLGPAFYWGLAAIPLFALSNLWAGAMRGFHHVVGAQYYEVLVRPAILVCLLLIAGSHFGGVDAENALALQVLATMVALVLSLWHLLRIAKAHGVHRATPATQPSGWMASAFPMTGTEMIRALEGLYPILLIGWLATTIDVGLFRVALSSAGFFGLPSSLISVVVMSHVATLHAEGRREQLQLLATASAMAMAVCVVTMTIAMYFLGESLIAHFFGEAFRSAWPVLIALGVAYSVNAFFGSTASILNMTGHERVVAFSFASGLVVGMALAPALLGPMGIVGAGVAAIAAELVKGGIMWFAALRLLKVDTAATSVLRMWSRR